MNMQAAGWFPDPMQRHQFRWWTGIEWSEHVSDGGVSAVDPLVSPAQPQQAAASPFQQQPAAQQPYQQVPYQQVPYQQVPYQQGAYQQAAFQPDAFQPPGRTVGFSPEPVAARPAIGWFTLAAAAAAGLSSVLHWLDSRYGSVGGFDVPFKFLFDYKTAADSAFTVGLVVLIVAVSAAVPAFVRAPALRVASRVAGALLVVIGVLYSVQLYRSADLVDMSLLDVLGIGPVLAIAGGLGVLFANGR